MKRIFINWFYLTMSILFLLVNSLPSAQANIWYVDGDMVSSGNGMEWGTAFKTIQEGIDTADTEEEIWVKIGTYPITYQINVDKVVSLYGGFDGTETKIDQRDLTNNTTTVDGQGAVDHCFYINADATIDGFLITGGYASADGGGIFNYFSSPTITNCTFYQNYASWSGGGISNWESSPRIANCTFHQNSADRWGGGISSYQSSPTITSCTFSDNFTNFLAGGIHNYTGSPTITNCILTNNRANASAGAIFLRDCTAEITNCTITENTSILGGVYSYTTTLTITNSILWGNTSSNDLGEEIYLTEPLTTRVSYSNVDQDGYDGTNGNIRLDPLFVGGGDYHLQVGSPCIDAGTSDGVPETDMEGDSRYDNPIKINTGGGNYPYYDIGAYEYRICFATFALGGDSRRNDLNALRKFRDEVLSKIPAGQEIIKLYYELSPAIVKILEEDEGLKEYVKEMIEAILPVIKYATK